MHWSGVLPCFYEELTSQSHPDILVIHTSGNDLGLVSAKDLAFKMKRELIQLHHAFLSMTIAYSCIKQRVWRYGWPAKINNDRKLVKTLMRNTDGNFGVKIIVHPNV